MPVPADPLRSLPSGKTRGSRRSTTPGRWRIDSGREPVALRRRGKVRPISGPGCRGYTRSTKSCRSPTAFLPEPTLLDVGILTEDGKTAVKGDDRAIIRIYRTACSASLSWPSRIQFVWRRRAISILPALNWAHEIEDSRTSSLLRECHRQRSPRRVKHASDDVEKFDIFHRGPSSRIYKLCYRSAT